MLEYAHHANELCPTVLLSAELHQSKLVGPHRRCPDVPDLRLRSQSCFFTPSEVRQRVHGWICSPEQKVDISRFAYLTRLHEIMQGLHGFLNWHREVKAMNLEKIEIRCL